MGVCTSNAVIIGFDCVLQASPLIYNNHDHYFVHLCSFSALCSYVFSIVCNNAHSPFRTASTWSAAANETTKFITLFYRRINQKSNRIIFDLIHSNASIWRMTEEVYRVYRACMQPVHYWILDIVICTNEWVPNLYRINSRRECISIGRVSVAKWYLDTVVVMVSMLFLLCTASQTNMLLACLLTNTCNDECPLRESMSKNRKSFMQKYIKLAFD